ncbi:hypothetical protein [Deinococcus sp. QL22]|uniref:hypothetical protein n=1 Tax=Deinococcus sp. QL22 TaxID=2939437 RepID=UPI0020181826|nr:hypothetical protein [Deinococcus sp. QL22]UQN10297.1 hypothetical protein M1R55_29540 [Deinococcus sp. QL22]UQN10431.1 hypothetical protein M1R55_28865 [Deinococcus sp. QL22]
MTQIQPTPQPVPVPVYALHERLPHRPRPNVVRRMAFPLMALGFMVALVALMSLGGATRADLLPLAGVLVTGCLLFAVGVRAAPGKVSEYMDLGELEWLE